MVILETDSSLDPKCAAPPCRLVAREKELTYGKLK